MNINIEKVLTLRDKSVLNFKHQTFSTCVLEVFRVGRSALCSHDFKFFFCHQQASRAYLKTITHVK